jgi:hypothetical protein
MPKHDRGHPGVPGRLSGSPQPALSNGGHDARMAGSTTLLRPLAAEAPPFSDRRTPGKVWWPEVAVGAAGFCVLCLLVLTRATAMLEPDDYAYQASIVALSQGHVLLTTSQYHELSRLLGDGGRAIPQWVHLPDGRWIGQKNPGYPFLAVLFYAVGALRAGPLFYGALASVALFVGGRRWLGPWGGTIAVLLYCTSGAAITFAWRPTMETFTDASLVATGAGLLLWTMLAVDASARRRFLAGLAGFAALEAATFTRYTDVVELAVAVVAVFLTARRCGLGWRMLAGWMTSVAGFGISVLVFDAAVYGSPLKTGYAPGLIAFSLSAVGPNLAHMSAKLIEAMPMAVVAAGSIVWIAARCLVRPQGAAGPQARRERRRDGAVAMALVAGWVAVWGLYLGYTWTVSQSGADPVHVVRFYLPALGAIALLGAWALVRLPLRAWVAVVLALLGAGLASFHVLSATGAPGPPGVPGTGHGGRGLLPSGRPPPAGSPPSAGGPGGGAPGPPRHDAPTRGASRADARSGATPS